MSTTLQEIKTSNHLAGETSPYLQQHANNPVDWHPWGEEPLAKAHQEDKPILLSIGYSACHWCHVMAHESFEDPATAQVMNELFVNIKIDREERPDLDKIYQNVHQLLTQRAGGWPLTVFLTPEDLNPYFAGTYFPKAPRYGMPTFVELMLKVEGYYRHRMDEIKTQNSSLQEALRSMDHVATANLGTLGPAPLDGARKQLEQLFDAEHGGFGSAPKFPHPTNIERLMRHWAATVLQGAPDEKALQMVTKSLKAMAEGGIYDQLGGGFYRYAVDEQWMTPHFEKMLYDNGPLLALYAEAWQITGDEDFRHVAEDTGAWVMREMQSLDGGYYSTQDADSNGKEGCYYIWDREVINTLLDDDEYYVAARMYGITQEANFEGKWHLHRVMNTTELATEMDISQAEVEALLLTVKEKLFKYRFLRQAPGRDEKILSSWNGLMIKGMASAGRRLHREDFIESAQHAVDFIKMHLYKDGRLLAVYKDGKSRLNAYLDDYVFLIDGIIELLQARWRYADMKFAIELMDVVLEHYQDNDLGGFFFTSDDHEQLIHRPRPLADDAMPSGNGIAAYVLTRLGHLLGDMRYLDAAEKTLRMAWDNMSQVPHAHNALLLALEECLYPSQTIILQGKGKSLSRWRSACDGYAPRRLCIAIPHGAEILPGFISGSAQADDKTVAYHCTERGCEVPVYVFEDFEKLAHQTTVPTL